MLSPLRLGPIPFLGCLLATLPAQHTYVVAPAGGDFTQISQAAQVVQHGDTVIVRAGVYQSFILDKGIRLVGEPGAVVLNHPVGWAAIRIYSIPAGATLTMIGFRGQPSMGLELGGCVGHVHLEDLDALELSNVDAPHRIMNCAEVSLSNVRMLSGLPIHNSRVTLAQCSARSYDPGLQITNHSHVTVADSSVTMGSWTLDNPALWVRDSTLLVAGDASSRFVAYSNAQPIPAIDAQNSTVVVDPEVTLTSAHGAPAIGGTGNTVVSQSQATLATSHAPNAVSMRLRAPLAGMGFTLLSLTARPPIGIPLGVLWLDPSTLVLVDAGPLVQGVRGITLPLPPGLPRGLTVALQSLVSEPAGTQLSYPRILALP